MIVCDLKVFSDSRCYAACGKLWLLRHGDSRSTTQPSPDLR